MCVILTRHNTILSLYIALRGIPETIKRRLVKKYVRLNFLTVNWNQKDFPNVTQEVE